MNTCDSTSNSTSDRNHASVESINNTPPTPQVFRTLTFVPRIEGENVKMLHGYQSLATYAFVITVDNNKYHQAAVRDLVMLHKRRGISITELITKIELIPVVMPAWALAEGAEVSMEDVIGDFE